MPPSVAFDPKAGPSRMRALEIVLAKGDVVHTTSRVILLGRFQGMEPSAAWRSVDREMDEALSRLRMRKASESALGELDVVPTGRYYLMADLVAFLGLGKLTEFDSTAGSSLEYAMEHGVRGLLVCQVDELATVLMGTNMPVGSVSRSEGDLRGSGVEFSVDHMLKGLMRALAGEKEGRSFRRITIAETDSGRYDTLKKKVIELKKSGFFGNLEVEVLEETLRRSAAMTEQPKCNQLMLATRNEAETGKATELQVTLNPWERLAALRREASQNFGTTMLEEIYRLAGLVEEPPPAAVPVGRNLKKSGRMKKSAIVSIEPLGMSRIEDLEAVSAAVTGLIPDGILDLLSRNSRQDERKVRPKLEIHDDNGSAAVPWECLKLRDGSFPALECGLSRRLASPRARIADSIPQTDRLRVLLVINPTNDLPKAAVEGEDLARTLSSHAEVRILREGATVRELTKVLNKDFFHILHYAGHSGFNRGREALLSGLKLADGYFTGENAIKLLRLPAAVVFNSCESARIERLNPVDSTTANNMTRRRDAADGAVTIAEAFITAGAHHFIGTFWPVKDAAAKVFAQELYGRLATGSAIGAAIMAARNKLLKIESPDWANYIHYGDQDAVLFPTSEF